MKILAWSICLLIASYNLGQLYEFWNGYDTHTVNWVFFADVQMNVAWNVKYLSEEVSRVLEAIAFFLMVKKTGLKPYILTCQVYLVYRCLDIPYYFINFKTAYYDTIWIWLALIEVYLNRKEFNKKHYIYK